jgi:hypothetical protein
MGSAAQAWQKLSFTSGLRLGRSLVRSREHVGLGRGSCRMNCPRLSSRCCPNRVRSWWRAGLASGPTGVARDPVRVRRESSWGPRTRPRGRPHAPRAPRQRLSPLRMRPLIWSMRSGIAWSPALPDDSQDPRQCQAFTRAESRRAGPVEDPPTGRLPGLSGLAPGRWCDMGEHWGLERGRRTRGRPRHSGSPENHICRHRHP